MVNTYIEIANFALIKWFYVNIFIPPPTKLEGGYTGFTLSVHISRHYKKSLLRSQIYDGCEELSTDTNYPI